MWSANLGSLRKRMEQGSLADAVLALHNYCALVTDSGNEGNILVDADKKLFMI